MLMSDDGKVQTAAKQKIHTKPLAAALSKELPARVPMDSCMPALLLVSMAACHSYHRAVLRLLMGADKALGVLSSDRLNSHVEFTMHGLHQSNIQMFQSLHGEWFQFGSGRSCGWEPLESLCPANAKCMLMSSTFVAPRKCIIV